MCGSTYTHIYAYCSIHVSICNNSTTIRRTATDVCCRTQFNRTKDGDDRTGQQEHAACRLVQLVRTACPRKRICSVLWMRAERSASLPNAALGDDACVQALFLIEPMTTAKDVLQLAPDQPTAVIVLIRGRFGRHRSCNLSIVLAYIMSVSASAGPYGQGLYCAPRRHTRVLPFVCCPWRIAVRCTYGNVPHLRRLVGPAKKCKKMNRIRCSKCLPCFYNFYSCKAPIWRKDLHKLFHFRMQILWPPKALPKRPSLIATSPTRETQVHTCTGERKSSSPIRLSILARENRTQGQILAPGRQTNHIRTRLT